MSVKPQDPPRDSQTLYLRTDLCIFQTENISGLLKCEPGCVTKTRNGKECSEYLPNWYAAQKTDHLPLSHVGDVSALVPVKIEGSLVTAW